MESDAIVQPGATVIVVTSDGSRYFANATADAKQRFGKQHVSLAALAGKPYGSVFELGKNTLRHLPGEAHLTRSEKASAALAVDAATTADNRNLVDRNASQRLSPEEIAALREGGATGAEIISALVEHSDTWHSKTAFSQQKWLARKEQKYAPRLRVVRCDAESVCESYFAKHRERMGNLRPDSLAQILANANIFAGIQVTVFDGCMGVVLGAVVERMGGLGRVLAPYSGSHPSCDALRQFNFTEQEESVVKAFHTSEVGKLAATANEPVPDESPAAIAARTQAMLDDVPEFLAKKLASFDKAGKAAERAAYLGKRNARLRRMGAKPHPASVRHWLRQQSDSLVVACPLDPTAVLLGLWPSLAPAAPFVVFSEYLEPLVHCFRELQRRCLACKLQLSNTWTRQFQVLPGRTHPHMHMSSCSGFILSGVKVQKREDGWHFVEKVHDPVGDKLKRPKLSHTGTERGNAE